MTVELSAWVMSLFLFGFGGLFLFLASKQGRDDKLLIFNVRQVFILFALGYFFLAHFTVMTGFAYSIEYGFQAPCENVIQNSTVLNSTATQYQYVDTCEAREMPQSQDNILLVWTYLMWFELFALFGGLALLFMRRLLKLW